MFAVKPFQNMIGKLGLGIGKVRGISTDGQ